MPNNIRRYVDLDLNFAANPFGGDVSMNVGDQAVIGSVLNLLLTNHYERPFHPEIGANITKLLFENITSLTANALQREITNTIENYEPRVLLSVVTVTANPDQNGFDVALEFFINNNANPISIALFLERIV